MRLGDVLAIIRNNDGFNGLLNVLDTLFMCIPERAKEVYLKSDNETVKSSCRKKKGQKEKVKKELLFLKSILSKEKEGWY